jgi:hypothetical protein
MADSKISALPASTTPLAGTEVLPIVQSSTTRQVSVANLTAGRAISATQLTLTTGNLIVASGQGIDFSATSGAGTSELLADYEEGTWTPTGNGITFSSAAGKYTKIGNVVVATFSVTFPTTVDANNAQIGGLPFTVGTASAAAINGNLTITQLTPNVGATSMSFLTTNNAAYSTNANLSTQPYTGAVSYRV